MDDALKDGTEDATSSLPRGASMWTWLEGNPEWTMVVEWILVMPHPVQLDSERARSLIFFSFMVLMVASSCAQYSPRVPRVRTFQHAILVFNLACKKFNFLVWNFSFLQIFKGNWTGKKFFFFFFFLNCLILCPWCITWYKKFGYF